MESNIFDAPSCMFALPYLPVYYPPPPPTPGGGGGGGLDELFVTAVRICCIAHIELYNV